MAAVDDSTKRDLSVSFAAGQPDGVLQFDLARQKWTQPWHVTWTAEKDNIRFSRETHGGLELFEGVLIFDLFYPFLFSFPFLQVGRTRRLRPAGEHRLCAGDYGKIECPSDWSFSRNNYNGGDVGSETRIQQEGLHPVGEGINGKEFVYGISLRSLL